MYFENLTNKIFFKMYMYIFHSFQETVRGDPNNHSYVQSSFYSYSNTGQGAPKVYQASSSTRTAPGGVGFSCI